MKRLSMRFKSRLVWETVGVAILSAFPLYIFANVTVEGQVSQSNITSKYTSQCTSNYSYALYEGQSFVSSNIHTPTTLLSSWEYFPQTNIKTYNPYNVFGDQPTQNSLGGLIAPFIYKSNGRPGTTHFGGAGVPSVYIYKQNGPTYAVTSNPNPMRDEIAAQIVHNFYRKQIIGWGAGGTSYTMTYLPYGGNTASVSANPNTRNPMVDNTKCQNFYVAKCGDNIIDNPEQSGGASTDGRNGILVAGSVLNWRNTGFEAELCDDGPLNGTVGYCDINCGRGGITTDERCGDEIIQDAGTYYNGWPETLENMSFEVCDDGDEEGDTDGLVNGNDPNYAFCDVQCTPPFIEEFAEVFVNP